MTTQEDMKLINAFRVAFSSAKSITVKRATLWSAAGVGVILLPVEVWVTLPNGETKIERGTDDNQLLLVAARLTP